MKSWLTILVLALVLTAPAVGLACPNCKDAVEATSSDADNDGDPYREGKAYNRSIYLMVSMPYLILGTVGIVTYRSYRAAHRPSPA